MKYIILASLLSSAALAAPFAQQAQGNTNAGATQAGAQTQTGAGQATGQTQQQGATQGTGVQGQTGTQGTQGSTGAVNSPQQGQGVANGQTPTDGDLATAVSNWQADTSMVSNFLDTGASIQNNVAFKQAATVAFNAEVDELNHKAIIDQATGQTPQVQAANSTLATAGAFQDVVDKLQEMSVKGRAAVQNIDLINQNRCVNVLPNIDAYMASTGSSSQAVRPQVCDQTGVAGGVQGNGPTQPGDTPGTPQAAFDAAQALASGQGNGQVQNGGTAGTATGQAQGTQGTQGTQGAQGTGAQGTQGTQGTQGQAGQAPTQGQAGTAAGAQAPTQGQAGAAQGQTGATGAQAQQGAQGQQAAQGQAGATQSQQAGAAQGQQAGTAGAQGQTGAATQ